MKNISLENITQAVVNHGDQGKTHPRLHEIYASLVRHLHAFVREVNLTEEELQLGRDFLTRAWSAPSGNDERRGPHDDGPARHFRVGGTAA